ncbi:MAG: hypothetical protein L0Y44_07355 [Phycisphaerales bacterium]|nr:hypothetical protein [Phycisphaerales bacterium]MCI0630455.1 hypothetical protein [Phycisphaerales bacterium]MCI0674616.1 hypothetical protein [Phycisphaerales bacterium]
MSTANNEDSPSRPGSRSTPPTPAGLPSQQKQAYFGEGGGRVDEGRNDGLKLVVVALLIIGAIAISLALIFRSVDKSANSNTSNVPSALAEHNQLMREAIQMAREAQELNRQRMAQMRQAMMEAEGYAEHGEYPGPEDYVSDP